MTTLTNAQIVAELGWTRKAIKSILGVTPLTMRPPFGDMGQLLFFFLYHPFVYISSIIDDRVRAISLAMGMLPIIWTGERDGAKFDTNGLLFFIFNT